MRTCEASHLDARDDGGGLSDSDGIARRRATNPRTWRANVQLQFVERADVEFVGSYTYDANGNTLSDASGKSYTWDFENRMVQAVVPGTNGGTSTFKYDPFGRRIQKSGPGFESQRKRFSLEFPQV